MPGPALVPMPCVNTCGPLPIETRMALSKTKLAVFELGTRTLEALAEARRLSVVLGDEVPSEVAEALLAAPTRRAAVLRAPTETEALTVAREALAEAEHALHVARSSTDQHRSGLRALRDR